MNNLRGVNKKYIRKGVDDLIRSCYSMFHEGPYVSWLIGLSKLHITLGFKDFQ